MFLRAFLTIVAADAVDRQRREQQHRAHIAELEARVAAAERLLRPEAPVPPASGTAA